MADSNHSATPHHRDGHAQFGSRGPLADKPRVRRIGSLVGQLMARRGYAQVAAGEELHRSLIRAVGAELGSSCRVGKLRAGVLQIFASDSVTLQELNFRKRAILRQLQQDMPENKLLDVRFRILT